MPRKRPNRRNIAAAALLGALAGLGLGGAAQPEQSGAAVEPAADKLPDKPLQVGDQAPLIKLRNDRGEWVELASLLERGPVVIAFYRGAWCPYCNRELSDIQQKIVPVAEDLGATVLAISPEAPEHAVELKEKRSLSFDLLHDEENKAAKRFGVGFTLDADTVKKYQGYNIDVAAHNGSDAHELPIPATYIIDTDGVIRYAYVNEDYSKRAKPKDVIAALEKIVHPED